MIHSDIVQSYLDSVVHMSLATVQANKPWVCEVHFVFDEAYNLYFRSLPTRRHSQDIEQNPQVAGNIVEQHTLTMAPRGLYFEGVAERMTDEAAMTAAVELFNARLGNRPGLLEEALTPDGHQIYKITVDNWYMFDARDHSPSEKIKL